MTMHADDSARQMPSDLLVASDRDGDVARADDAERLTGLVVVPRQARSAIELTAGSTMLGAAVGAATGNAALGAMLANNATTNNHLLHENEKAKIKQLRSGLTLAKTS